MANNPVPYHKPWYEQINDIIDKRNHSCGLNGQGFVYNIPKDSFNTKRSASEFENDFPFNLKSDCIRPSIRRNAKKDSHNRFFKDVNDVVSCRAVHGIWDHSAVNRSNRFGKGTCWVNQDDATCGKFGVPAVLRRENTPNKIAIVKEASDKCNANDKCTWFKLSGQPADCMRKDINDLAGISVELPPDNMPLDITNGNIEQFLEEWFLYKKHGIPPTTKDLFGFGDRCNPSKLSPSNDFKSTIDDLKNVDIHSLDMRKPDNQRIMRRILETMGAPGVENTLKKLIKRARLIADDPDAPVHGDPLADIAKDFAEFLKEELDFINQQSVTRFLPSIPQSVVNMLMKHIALKNSSNRGIMALHSTGSGKTCTATGVMDAFWDSKKQIVFVSSIDAVAANPPFKFHECATRLFPRFKREPFVGNNIDDTLARTAKLFEDRGIIFLPFAKLANRIVKTEKFKNILKIKKGGAFKRENPSRNIINVKKNQAVQLPMPRLAKDSPMSKLLDYLHDLHHIDKPSIYAALKAANITSRDDYVDLDHTCLIIDEVHNLFRPLPMQREKHKLVEKHIIDPASHPNLKVVILTATPGDNVTDIIKLLNIVRDPSKPPILPPNVDSSDSIKLFKESIRGIISFFDMSFDTTQFPIVYDQGPIKYPMSNKQFEKYIEAYKDVKDTFKDYDKLAKANQLNKFWQGPRKYANMLFNFDNGLKLSEFSSKLPALLDNIKAANDQKHYVYSSFYEARGSGQGILEIARQLEAMGYQKLTVKEAKELNLKKTLPSKAKRYVLALQKDIGDEASSSAGINLAHLVDIFNHPLNKHGDFVHVFLATQGFNEGIDLKAVRHIHFFEPLVTMASDLQTIGRARRFCSHKDLDRDKGEWSVQIHRYLADLPLSASFNDIDHLKKQISSIEHSINDNKLILDKIKGVKKDKVDALYNQLDFKESIKLKITDLNFQLKEAQKSLKSAIKTDLKNIKNIDEFVYQQAIEKMKELFIIHNAIKEAAVDCRLLNSFHNSVAPNPFKCAF